MNIVGLILARKGSKRLKNKNIKLFKKKPLIFWTIILSIKKTKISKFILSTDYPNLKKYINKYNLIFNGQRPAYLSKSHTSSLQVSNYEIKKYEKKYEKIEILILLQPTSPFRSVVLLNKAINEFIKYKMKRSVVSYNKNSKNITPNGNFYITSPKLLKLEKNFYSNKSLFFPMSHKRFSIDIDTQRDFNNAKKFIKYLK